MPKQQIKNWTATNQEAVRQAVSTIASPGSMLGQWDIRVDSTETYEVQVHSAYGSNKSFPFDVLVRWPDGQEGHGFVEVGYELLPGLGNITQKFACWKTGLGGVAIAPWSGPSAAVSYQHKYGLQWPRGVARYDGGVVASLFVLMFGAILLLVVPFLPLLSLAYKTPEQIAVAAVLVQTLAAVICWVGLRAYRQGVERSKIGQWENDIQKTKSKQPFRAKAA